MRIISKSKVRRFFRRLIMFALLAVLIDAIVLYFNGKLWFNNPSRADYPIRGVDVSEHQGDVDWEKLMSQSLDFAFVKATEGSGYVDGYYLHNREKMKSVDAIYGFYHFFSFESTGKSQAKNFVDTVGDLSGFLPPVVDIELYGRFKLEPPEKSEVVTNLTDMLTALEAEYGVKPIIYTTKTTYSEYLEGHFKDYPIWIRSVFTKASLPDGRDWTFWQFTDKAVLYGYSGEEKFIDLNVFNGSKSELQAMLVE